MPGLLSKIFKPLTDVPSRVAKKAADTIDNPKGEGGYLRGFGAGALEGAGNLASDMTSPFSIGMQAIGAGGVGRLAKLLSAAKSAKYAEAAAPELGSVIGRLGAEYAPVGSEAAVNTARAANMAKEAKDIAAVAQKGSVNAPIGAKNLETLIASTSRKRPHYSKYTFSETGSAR